VGTIGKSARDRLERRLVGATMRMYVRISRVGNRKRAADASVGDRVLWSDEDQIAAGHQCCSEWAMTFDEAESRVHADPDVSGFSTAWDRRPGLFAHFEDAQRGEFQVLGFHFADRIGRNVRETIKAIDAFLDLDVVIYVAEDDEFVTRDDLAAINRLHGQMVNSERYSIKLADRVRSAHRRRALSGRHHGGPAPAWLEWNPSSRRYEVVERVAELMRHMVDLRLRGHSEGAITRILNETSRTKNGKLWRQSNVNRYLSARFIEKMEGHSHFCVRGEEPILIKDQWEAILDPQTAAELKLTIASTGKRTYYERHFENKANGVRTRAASASSPFLLTGRIYCSVCGSRVLGLNGGCRDRDRYACNGAISTHTKHPNAQTYFNRAQVEQAVLNALSTWLCQPPSPPDPPAARARVDSDDRQITQLTAQIDALLDFHLAGEWSRDDYLRKHQELVDRRSALERKKLEVARPAVQRSAQELAARSDDRVARRQLIHLLVERIELPVYPKRAECVRSNRPYVRVCLRYPMPDGTKALLAPILRKRDMGPVDVLPD